MVVKWMGPLAAIVAVAAVVVIVFRGAATGTNWGQGATPTSSEQVASTTQAQGKVVPTTPTPTPTTSTATTPTTTTVPATTIQPTTDSAPQSPSATAVPSKGAPSTKSTAKASSTATKAETMKEEKDEGLKCPKMLQPKDVGFLVINLDRSPKRLQRMRDRFEELGLPQFERVPGVEYHPERGPYDVPLKHRGLKPADFGTCLAHLKAWKHVYSGSKRWYVVLEDDTELLENATYLGPWPKIPVDADLTLLRVSSMFETHPVCKDTPVLRATWGFGMVGYLVNRAGAGRLIKGAKDGFASPIDGHIWYHNKVYVTDKDWVTHGPCANPCPTSIRTYLNGEIDVEPD
eukprot:m.362241 g.362241  ORF g.362241 m.362241 type:complete len:346 (-) comp20236_c0_seq1:291-1328(-)